MWPSSMMASRSHSWSAQAARGVEAGRGLVEEQDVRRVHERRCEVEAALHPARVALDAAVGRVLELDQREQLAGALGRLARGEPEQPRLQIQQLAAGLARVEPRFLQRHADAPAETSPASTRRSTPRTASTVPLRPV
jgi:hypothetical protein